MRNVGAMLAMLRSVDGESTVMEECRIWILQVLSLRECLWNAAAVMKRSWRKIEYVLGVL